MSSHVRYFLLAGSNAYCGGNVGAKLSALTGEEIRGKDKIMGAAAKLGRSVCKLWVIRERRKQGMKTSRYRRLISAYGIALPRRKPQPKKKKKTNATTYQPVGQAAQFTGTNPHLEYCTTLQQVLLQQQANVPAQQPGEFFGGQTIHWGGNNGNGPDQ